MELERLTRVPAGAVSEHVSAFQDVMPTVLELARAPERPPTDGLSFVPTLLGRGEQPEHDHLYWELRQQQALRNGNWKIVRRWNPRKKSFNDQVFNLETDIGESRDLSKSNPVALGKLQKLLRAARKPSTQFPAPYDAR